MIRAAGRPLKIVSLKATVLRPWWRRARIIDMRALAAVSLPTSRRAWYLPIVFSRIMMRSAAAVFTAIWLPRQRSKDGQLSWETASLAAMRLITTLSIRMPAVRMSGTPLTAMKSSILTISLPAVSVRNPLK